MKDNNLTILLPAYNEEKNIGRTIDDIREYAPNAEILVVINCCTNGTRRIAEDRGVLVYEVWARGKGNAIRQSIGFVGTDYCVMMDSDCTYPAKHIPEIAAELEGGADVVMGYRAGMERNAMTVVNAFGNWCLSLLASLLYGVKVRDVCTGMWGFRRETLLDFTITSPRFTLEADLFVNAARANCNIAQLPIGYRARLVGDPPKLKVRDGLEIGWFLVRKRFQWP